MGLTKVYAVNLLNEETTIKESTLEQMVTVGVQTPEGESVSTFPSDMANEIFDGVCEDHDNVAMFSMTLKDGQPIGQPIIERHKGDYFKKPTPFVEPNQPNFFDDMAKFNPNN